MLTCVRDCWLSFGVYFSGQEVVLLLCDHLLIEGLTHLEVLSVNFTHSFMCMMMILAYTTIIEKLMHFFLNLICHITTKFETCLTFLEKKNYRKLQIMIMAELLILPGEIMMTSMSIFGKICDIFFVT